MKKVLALFLTILLVLTVAIGCSKPVQQEAPAPQSTTPATTETTTPATTDTTTPPTTDVTTPTTTDGTTPATTDGSTSTTNGSTKTSSNSSGSNTSTGSKTGSNTSGSDAVSSASTEPTTPSVPTTPTKPTKGTTNPTTPTPKPPTPSTPPPTTTPTPTPPDAVASASIVSDNAAFETAISPAGKWIIAITKDLTFDKPIVLTGNFTNTKPADATTGLKTIQRKIALYSQDDKHVVTARFTLTAPKLTILSPNASIQHGTFKGDLYVGVSNFKLVDAVVDGNVYFTNKDAQTTFLSDATSKITGKQEYVGVDAVTTASIANNNDGFEKAIAKDGKWIIAALNNLTFDKELVLTGNFTNTKPADATTGLKTIQRKIALYTQDDKHVTTGRFIVTAPKMTILSPNASIQKGMFKGDLYVGVPNFQLIDAVVDGNIYFTTQDAMDTFKPDATSLVTGKQEYIGVDAIASASVTADNATFEKAMSKDGTWIMAPLKNLTFSKELVLAGDFHEKNLATNPLKRKIALYTQDDKHVTTARFMLTAPKLTITSTNATIQKGIFKGDIYVSAAGFNLVDAVVDGNIYFTTQEAKDTFVMDATSLVTGKQELLK